MVRKYNPQPFTSWGDYGNEYPDANMVESHIGAWVKLETYNDETMRLKRQVDRQKDIVKKLRLALSESVNIRELIELTPEDIIERYYTWVNK